MTAVQFEGTIARRIDDLRHEMQVALMDDDYAEAARVECALGDLERLRRENLGA